ncbi:ATP-dependent nuclease [Deinococcus sp.]|uniref:ATP-dependent nuclease n=1 Tax=Deinococcus sp. TaxID=47478 RepID=UPI003B594B39
MLKNIKLQITDDSGSQITFEADGMTIFVGPNNSGKSLILREIEMYIQRSSSHAYKILDDIKLAEIPDNEIEELLRNRRYAIDGRREYSENNFPIVKLDYSTSTVRMQTNYDSANLKSFMFGGGNYFTLAYLYTTILDGKTRLTILDTKESHDLQVPPRNINMLLLKDKNRRKQLRGIILKAFGIYLSVDMTGLKDIKVRFSQNEPSEEFETSVSSGAISFQSDAILYEDSGDGLKAFTGIVGSILLSQDRILLLDEPEAFLHPPLARTIGEEIVGIVSDRNASLVVATHSSDFLIGVLQSYIPVRIIRLTFTRGVAKAKIIDNDEVRNLTKNPVMRSANVLSGLFHDGVVITEDDSDRVLYQEVNYRLIKHDSSGSSGTLFLNANGKSSLHKMAGPLRRSGVPAAICADFDYLFQASEFSQAMDVASIPTAISESMKRQKEEIFRNISNDEKKQIKSLGLRYFSGDSLASVTELLQRLDTYGIFIVPNGELESWLTEMKVEGQKVNRVMQILEKMGSDQEDRDYAFPKPGDIWDYIRKVTEWIKDPARKGMS